MQMKNKKTYLTLNIEKIECPRNEDLQSLNASKAILCSS